MIVGWGEGSRKKCAVHHGPTAHGVFGVESSWTSAVNQQHTEHQSSVVKQPVTD